MFMEYPLKGHLSLSIAFDLTVYLSKKLHKIEY